MLGFLKRFRKERRRKMLSGLNPQEVFSRYYHRNTWGDRESASGKGSNLEVTRVLRGELAALVKRRGITSMLDVPCGDFNWMREVDLSGVSYTGGDIVPDLIAANKAKYEAPNRQFQVIDLTTTPLPQVDLLFVRDCLVHLSFDHLRAALANIRASGSRYLLVTTFPGTPANEDIVTGEWRALDMRLPPFNFGEPLELINEKEGGEFSHKSMGLWDIASLPEMADTTA